MRPQATSSSCCLHNDAPDAPEVSGIGAAERVGVSGGGGGEEGGGASMLSSARIHEGSSGIASPGSGSGEGGGGGANSG